jgi:ABC-type transporter Mla subunit MlaD
MALAVALVSGCGDKPEEEQSAAKAVKEVKEETQTAAEKTSDLAKDAVKDAKEGARAVAEKTGDLAKEAVEKTKTTVAGAADWTKEKVDEYLTKTGDVLSGFDTNFDDLAKKAEGLSGEAKDKFKEQFAALTDKREAALKELEGLKSSSGDAWVAAKDKFEELLQEMKELYDKIKSDFFNE